jgi:multiple sugar transport system permease protein
VVAAAVPLTVLFASWAGFAMTRLSRRATGMLVALTLVTLMVPLTALLVSRFAIYRILRLTDTYVPLIAPSLLGTTPFYVLLFYWSFRRLPAELFEACRLEGMGPVATWRRVAMPLVRPVTATAPVIGAFLYVQRFFLKEFRGSGWLGR